MHSEATPDYEGGQVYRSPILERKINGKKFHIQVGPMQLPPGVQITVDPEQRELTPEEIDSTRRRLEALLAKEVTPELVQCSHAGDPLSEEDREKIRSMDLEMAEYRARHEVKMRAKAALFGTSIMDRLAEEAAARREAESKVQPIFIEFLAPSQIMKYTPPADLVLVGDYHLVRGTVVVVGGPPGVGKSRSTLALAEAGATKFEWFGYHVHCYFKTLVIQNENGLFRLQREITEIDQPRLEQYLRVCPPPPFGMCFWREEFRDQLKRFAEYFGPQVVAMDPWNAIARDERAKDYLETFDIIRQVFPQGEAGPVLLIAAHTRKPTEGERANGRALLNLLAGSYVLGSVPRVVFVMQHASDDVAEDRVVWTCCKNNDGGLGQQSAWVRQNGIFTPVANFDWASWNEGEKEGLFPLEKVVEIIEENGGGVRRAKLAKLITDRGVSRPTAYRRIEEAEKAGLIKHQRGKDLFEVVQ
jgi:hypothetical protein